MVFGFDAKKTKYANCEVQPFEPSSIKLEVRQSISNSICWTINKTIRPKIKFWKIKTERMNSGTKLTEKC